MNQRRQRHSPSADRICPTCRRRPNRFSVADRSASSSALSRGGRRRMGTPVRQDRSRIARAHDHPHRAMNFAPRPPAMIKHSALALGLAASLAAVTLLRASGPVFWVTVGASDLLQGTSDGVFVGLDGHALGPDLNSRIDSPRRPHRFGVWRPRPTGPCGRAPARRPRAASPPGPARRTWSLPQPRTPFSRSPVSGTRVYYATGPEGRGLRR